MKINTRTLKDRKLDDLLESLSQDMNTCSDLDYGYNALSHLCTLIEILKEHD